MKNDNELMRQLSEDGETPKKNAGQVLYSLIHKPDTSKKIPPREFIGGIFPRGYSTIIGGTPGVGKSWFIDKFACDLSNGGEIFGGIGYEDKPRKSLLFIGELGADGMIERIQLANQKLNEDYIRYVDMSEAETKDCALALNKDDGQKNIIELIKMVNPDIVFFDSLISFFEGDESKPEGITKALKFLSKVARELNIAVVAVHHIRKRLSKEQEKPLVLDDIIGSSVINRLAGLVIGIEYNKNLQAVKVRCLKSWFEYFKPFTFKIKKDFYENGVSIEIDNNLKEEASIDRVQRKSSPPDTKTMIKAYLKGRGKAGASIKEISTALEIEHATATTILNRLEKQGEITKIKRGIYTITEKELNDNNLNFYEEDFS